MKKIALTGTYSTGKNDIFEKVNEYLPTTLSGSFTAE
jgi:nicotinamide riboside kinase